MVSWFLAKVKCASLRSAKGKLVVKLSDIDEIAALRFRRAYCYVASVGSIAPLLTELVYGRRMCYPILQMSQTSFHSPNPASSGVGMIFGVYVIRGRMDEA